MIYQHHAAPEERSTKAERVYVSSFKSDARYFCLCIFTFSFSFAPINALQKTRVGVCGLVRVCRARLVFVVVSVLKEHKEPSVGVEAQPLVL